MAMMRKLDWNYFLFDILINNGRLTPDFLVSCRMYICRENINDRMFYTSDYASYGQTIKLAYFLFISAGPKSNPKTSPTRPTPVRSHLLVTTTPRSLSQRRATYFRSPFVTWLKTKTWHLTPGKEVLFETRIPSTCMIKTPLTLLTNDTRLRIDRSGLILGLRPANERRRYKVRQLTIFKHWFQ